MLDPLGITTPWVSWNATSKTVYSDNKVFLTVSAVLYVPTVFILPRVMDTIFPDTEIGKERFKAWKNGPLKSMKIAWNICLASFSMWGAYLLAPHLSGLIGSNGLTDTLCDHKRNEQSCWDHPTSVVVMYFCLSKVPEFMDTIFLRLGKSPVIFLHWYHHITTMLYCWFANQIDVDSSCNGMFFATMNLIIHSFMYSYYALAEAGYRKVMAKYKLNMLLTTCQILQMVGGMSLLLASTRCSLFEPANFAFGFIMYTSYAWLFSELFCKMYVSKQCVTMDVRIARWFGNGKKGDLSLSLSPRLTSPPQGLLVPPATSPMSPFLEMFSSFYRNKTQNAKDETHAQPDAKDETERSTVTMG